MYVYVAILNPEISVEAYKDFEIPLTRFFTSMTLVSTHFLLQYSYILSALLYSKCHRMYAPGGPQRFTILYGLRF